MEDAIVVTPLHRLVVLEGNYVHLTASPWNTATGSLDEKWFITVDKEVAKERIIRRHLAAGIVTTEAEAAKRFEENDWPNGEYITAHSDIHSADRIIYSMEDSPSKKEY